MRKIIRIIVVSVSVLLVLFALCSCSEAERIKKLSKEYCEEIASDITAYFTELSETACGITPDKVTSTLTSVSLDYLKSEKQSFNTVLENKNPVFVVNMVMPGTVSDDDIEMILKEALHRDLNVNLYFDNDDSRIFCVGDGGVTVDMLLPKDGGAMREKIEYVFTDTVD